jgi:hypothetical protein
MKTLDITEANDLLESYLVDPNQEPVILTVNKKPVAVVLPTKGSDVETISLSFHPKFLAILERSKMRLAKEGGISSEDIRREFGLPPFQETKLKTKGRKSTSGDRKPKRNSQKRNGKKDGSQVRNRK